MPFIPVPNCYQATMVFTSSGQRVANVYNVLYEGAALEANLTLVASTLAEWWEDELLAFVPNTISLVLIAVNDIAEEHGIGIEYTTGLPLVGSSAQPTLPNNVTLAVKWTTGFRGRSFRGRTYHIGLAENAVVGDTVESTALTFLEGAYASLITALSSAGFPLCVASRYTEKAPRDEGIMTPVLASSIDAVVDSQRRRLTGRGR